jgi:hypothetical protein
MRLSRLLGLAPLLLLGCASEPYQVTPVSGKVTLDGKPLSKASVTFVPMASAENQAPGPTAQAITDADGRFQLSIDANTPGAVVGKSRIYITTLLSDPAMDDRDAGGPIRNVRDKVPERYNQKTDLVFEVPADGTDQANFDLRSR